MTTFLSRFVMFKASVTVAPSGILSPFNTLVYHWFSLHTVASVYNPDIFLLFSLMSMQKGWGISFHIYVQCSRHLGVLSGGRSDRYPSRHKEEVFGTIGLLWYDWHNARYHNGNQPVWERTCRETDETLGSTEPPSNWCLTRKRNLKGLPASVDFTDLYSTFAIESFTKLGLEDSVLFFMWKYFDNVSVHP